MKKHNYHAGNNFYFVKFFRIKILILTKRSLIFFILKKIVTISIDRILIFIKTHTLREQYTR